MNLDILEIGACDFDTEIDQAAHGTVGITVEPLKIYLDKLEEKPGWKKVNAAITDFDGEIDVFYVSQETIDKFKLPWWFKGCNSVNDMQSHAVMVTKEMLGDTVDLSKIFSVEKCRAMTFATMVAENKIESIKHLKIDTEGHDTVILDQYLRCCANKPSLYADTIIFECNKLSKESEVLMLLDRFKLCGYQVKGVLPKSVIAAENITLEKVRDDKSVSSPTDASAISVPEKVQAPLAQKSNRIYSKVGNDREKISVDCGDYKVETFKSLSMEIFSEVLVFIHKKTNIKVAIHNFNIMWDNEAPNRLFIRQRDRSGSEISFQHQGPLNEKEIFDFIGKGHDVFERLNASPVQKSKASTANKPESKNLPEVKAVTTVNANQLDYKTQYEKCIDVIRKFEPGLIGFHNLGMPEVEKHVTENPVTK